MNLMTNPKTARLALKLSKNAPHLAVGFGLVAIVGSTVWCCHSTLKVEGLLEKHHDKFAEIKAGREEFSPEEYTDRDFKQDMVKQYIRAGVDFVKLYGPPIALGLAGISAILWSHNKLTTRLNGVMAAYAVLQDRFAHYRERVRVDYGEEVEDDIYHGRRTQVDVVKEKDEEGHVQKKEVMTKTLDGVMVPGSSKYLTLFSTATSKRAMGNFTDDSFVLQSVMGEMNNRLEINGHVFLNEVYRALGMEDTTEGSVVGWVMKPDAPNYIDFGVWDGERSYMVRDQEGFEYNGVWIDFNVDGIIYDLI